MRGRRRQGREGKVKCLRISTKIKSETELPSVTLEHQEPGAGEPDPERGGQATMSQEDIIYDPGISIFSINWVLLRCGFGVVVYVGRRMDGVGG